MQTLNERMNRLMGFPVEVEVDGPLKLMGRITGVYSDYVIVEMQDTAHYVQFKSIKEITKSSKSILPMAVGESENQTEECLPTFHSQINAFSNQWLCVTRTGLDELQGILDVVNSDYAVIITKDKVKFIPIAQIICFHHPITESATQESGNEDSSTSEANEDQSQNKNEESKENASNHSTEKASKNNSSKNRSKSKSSLFTSIKYRKNNNSSLFKEANSSQKQTTTSGSQSLFSLQPQYQ